MLSAEEIKRSLSGGYEQRGLELKGPGSRTDAHFLAKVTRAMLSMGNLRDGGHVVIGLSDDDPAALLPGLEPAGLDSWLAYDDVARKIANYTDPPLRFDIATVKFETGAIVAVIQIFEFADVPHICVKASGDVLRVGALYVRTRKLPETSEVASSVEMREVIELATEKALRAYVETAERAGLALTTAPSAGGGASSDERYAEERDRAWT